METFRFRTGQEAADIIGFLEIIEHIDECTFHYHNQRSDFYNWMRDCIDKEIAEKIRNKSRNEMIKELKSCL